MAIDRQSERVILRRMYAFLKSRKLDATAHTLEHEARLKMDLSTAVRLISGGRWRKADKYLSSFFGAEGTSSSSYAALYLVRFERMVRALKLGSRAWAVRYYRSKVSPLVDNLSPADRAAALADCATALSGSSDLATLRRQHPDDGERRWQRAVEFHGYYKQSYDQGDGLFLCTQDTMDYNLVHVRRAAALGLRRYASPREKRSAESVADEYARRRGFLRAGGHVPFL